MDVMKRPGRRLVCAVVAAVVAVLVHPGGASAQEDVPEVATTVFAAPVDGGQVPETDRPPVALSPPDPEGDPADARVEGHVVADGPQELAAESLAPGQTLRRGDVVRSSNRQYRLVMQEDGNLVLYVKRRALWSTGTSGHPRARAVMQGDGNLVVYAPNRGPALWSSGTNGHPGAFLAVQTDANVVVYSPQRTALWSSGSVNDRLKPGERLKPGYVLYSPTRRVRLEMQGDGNLVAYGGNRALWNSGTGGRPGAWAVMQGDGNLVVYSKAGRARWSSGTAGHANAYAIVQADGNLVVYPPSGPALWNAQSFVDRLPAGRGLSPGQYLVSESGAHTLQMQGDGNLVVYAAGQAVWSTGTAGHPGAHLEMQGDGNLVVYPPSGPALWASGTGGNGGAQVFMQSDANLVIYAGGRAVWSRMAPSPGGPNAAIADTALQYVGQYGGAACVAAGRSGYTGGAPLGAGNNDDGECRAFVNCVVWIASGHRQWLGGGSGYFSQFGREGAVEVALGAATKGDIIQWPTNRLHTTIVVANLGGGRFDVVDSNRGLDHRVSRYTRTITAGEGARAFRMNP